MINEKRLLDTFLEYVQIDSETKNEKAMGERLVQDLKALGFECPDRPGRRGLWLQRLQCPCIFRGHDPGRSHDLLRPYGYGGSWKRDQACDQRRHYRHRRLHHPGRR